MGYPLPEDNALRGPFQPMRFEATVEECIVSEGEIPKDLAGGFYRTGPTWKRPTKQGNNALAEYGRHGAGPGDPRRPRRLP